MQQIGKLPLGDKGQASFSVDHGMVTADITYNDKVQTKMSISYPIMDLVTPLKGKILGAIQKVIPGNYEDKLLEEGWEKLEKFLGVPAQAPKPLASADVATAVVSPVPSTKAALEPKGHA